MAWLQSLITCPPGCHPRPSAVQAGSVGFRATRPRVLDSNPLAPLASYPLITLTVNVASNALPSVTNVATVGGGGDVNAANNEVTLVTPIARAPDLTITKSHTGNFTQGQTATYTITVSNIIGAAPTSGRSWWPTRCRPR